ncbi:synaptonemal complex 1 [Brachionus plicatilis]|uniref:Synaptonemal complex 1 n=1 Tax=Brachionus plicatilis TaxID=10195 RepID=A0A3M7QCD0_BRAPC|nr:synaptonemal complex 1 [Brachionus plicatilis]
MDDHVKNFDTHVENFTKHVEKMDNHVKSFDSHVKNFDTHIENFTKHVEKMDNHVKSFDSHVKKFDKFIEKFEDSFASQTKFVDNNMSNRFFNSRLDDPLDEIKLNKIKRKRIPVNLVNVKQFKDLSIENINKFLDYYGLDIEDDPKTNHINLAIYLGISKLAI